MDIILPLTLVIAAYLLGSISTAIVASKLFNFPDPRLNGSKNPGTTNVLRLGGKLAAAFTLLGDMLKGLIPVVIATTTGLSDAWIVLVAIAAFSGHLFPLYYGFKGGKGVATAMGIFIGINPLIGLVVLITWASAAFAFNISSLAALIACLLAPFYFQLVTHSTSFLLGLLVITVLIYWKHVPNIKKLLAGTENKISNK